MPVAGIKTVATSQNGLGAFIHQCLRLDLHYCDWAGSSTGMKSFLSSPRQLLAGLAVKYPHTEFRVSPRPNRHPVIKAHFVNGRHKAVCVRNMEVEQIRAKVEVLLQNTGEKNRKVRGRNVVSRNESVRGVWSPMHGGIKSV